MENPDGNDGIVDKVLDSEVVDQITTGAADLIEEQAEKHSDDLIDYAADFWDALIKKVASRRMRWLMRLIPFKKLLAQAGDELVAFVVKFLRDFKDRS